MALSKPYFTEANLAAPDVSTTANVAKSFLYGIQSMMRGTNVLTGTRGPEGSRPTGSYWTVVGSSDSITGSLDGSTTRIPGTAFDSTKWVRAAANGTLHSWIVLASPPNLDGQGNTWYFKMSYIGANDQTFTLGYSKVAYTGGTHLNDPTSTGEITFGATSQFCESAAQSHRMNYVTDASGNFSFYGVKNSHTYINYNLSILTLVDSPADSIGSASLDSHRVILVSAYETNNRGAHRGGGVGIFGANGGNGIIMRTHDGLQTLVQQTNVSAARPFLFASTALDDNVAASNPVTGGYDVFPVYVFSTRTSYVGLRGRIPDWTLAAGTSTAATAGMSVGCSIPTSGTMEKTVCGNVAVPFTVVPLL